MTFCCDLIHSSVTLTNIALQSLQLLQDLRRSLWHTRDGSHAEISVRNS